MKIRLSMAGGLLAALAADAADLSRDDLAKKLQALEKAPAPTKLAPGAMCYKPAGLAPRVEFVCPKCGEKTLYVRGTGTEAISAMRNAATYRRQVKEIQGLGLPCTLDESAFCQKCGKDAPEKVFALEIAWPGRPIHRATLGDRDDLLLVLAFLQGKDRYDAGPGGEKALKESLPRIYELLGIEAPKPAEGKKP